MLLSLYTNKDSGYRVGKNLLIRCIWYVMDSILMNSFIPGKSWRVHLLRLFGARIAEGVVVKPYLKVKYPWKLDVGPHSWIGEHVWIDNLDQVSIGDNTCLSQGVYICTGSHDWSSKTFDLITRPVVIGAQAWICAKAVIAPGTIIGDGVVVGMNSLASGKLEPWGRYVGSPATYLCERKIDS